MDTFLLQPQNLLIVGAVWTALQTLRKVLPKLTSHHIYARLAPVLPLVLASAAVWLPGAVADGTTVGSKVLLGLVLGAMVGHTHKLLKQTGLGQDRRIKSDD